MQHMCVSATLNVDGEPRVGGLGSWANVAVDCISTAVVEQESGQAEVAHLCETGSSFRLEIVFFELVYQLRNCEGRTNFGRGAELVFLLGVMNAWYTR